ncbi:MAG: hypothetical protein GY721_03870 [Deltaproteobacteria bacterium]|nr:hypothetical protein [Deltaproteobacteria bacterium]
MVKSNGALQMVAFHSHGSEYAVELQTVQEIVRQGEISSGPSQSDLIEGVINLRGRVVQIVDLERKFKKERGDAITNGKILVINADGDGFGILVDNISGIFSTEGDKIEPLSDRAEGSEYFTGMVKVNDRHLTLLDPLKLLSSDTISCLEEKGGAKNELDGGDIPTGTQGREKGEEFLKKEVLNKGQLLIEKKDYEGDGVENMQATLEEVQCILEAFGNGDLAAVESSIERLNAIADKRLYNEVGKVTRNLHTSLKDFQNTIDPGIKHIVQQGIPEATDHLAQVVEATEKAANRTIEMVESGHSMQDKMEEKVASFRKSYESFNKGEGDDSFIGSIEDFISSCEGHIGKTTECLTEILVAQSFQDLTGQAIKKVIPIVSEVENQLLHLIKTFSIELPDDKDGDEYVSESVTRVDQGGVDDMLASFGF